jgi:hypothetical protein
MAKNSDPVYSRTVVEFVAVANEFCKYVEHAGELKGEEILKILQRILPLMYLKASLLPALEPFFEDGNEKFVTEGDWNRINNSFKEKFGTADEFLEITDKYLDETESLALSSLAENMTDIYQDVKDFLLLYQTGTREVMNDAIWECRINYENIWGQKLVNALSAIHRFVYSGEEINKVEEIDEETRRQRDTSEWFISKRQKDYSDNEG